MARLFPKIDPSEIENGAERAVAQALVSGAHTRIDAYHSFQYVKLQNRGIVQERECDFVVIDPENGVLFVEVKGGSLAYNADDHTWVRQLTGGRLEVLKRDPFDQARTAMHELSDRIAENLGDSRPSFTFGYAVAFPNARFTGTLPQGLLPEMLWDAEGCREIGTCIQQTFDRFRRPGHGRLTPKEIETIQRTLFPRYDLVPVIWRKVEDQELRIRRLTEEQLDFLERFEAISCAKVEGVAGSGKTILAIAKAQSSARAGHRTLLACYNRPLAEWLRANIPEDLAGMLIVENFHSLVASACRAAGTPFIERNPNNDPTFWTEKAPALLTNATAVVDPAWKFDSVIIDEGQDFDDAWWPSIEGVFRDPTAKTCYYVFYDPNQRIYVQTNHFPNDLVGPITLRVNCRNTVQIAEHCARIAGFEPKSRVGAPEGEAPISLTAASLSEAITLAKKFVIEWCSPELGGLKYHQVAVLVRSNAAAEVDLKFGSIPVSGNLDRWRRDKTVLLSTWGRFKGLEADAIVCIEPTGANTPTDVAYRYVAHSRAKHMLISITYAAT